MAGKNRAFSVLVAKNVAHDATSISDLAEGELLIVNAATNAPVAPGSEISDVEAVKVIQGGAGVNRYFSPTIAGVNVTAYKGSEYAAAVGQEIEIACPAPTAGNTYNLVIINREDQDTLRIRQDKSVYSVVAEGSITTAETMAIALVAKINADPNARFTASQVAGTITLVADLGSDSDINLVGQFPLQPIASVVLQEVDTDTPYNVTEVGTVIESVASNFGSGTYQHVKTIEDSVQGFRGITNRRKFPAPIQQYFAVAGTNYDLYVIEFNDSHEAGFAPNDIEAPITLIVAIPDGSTTAGAYFEDIMNPWLASTPKAFAPVNIVA
jgi:hypothetical protein